jgi:hypothetical protein
MFRFLRNLHQQIHKNSISSCVWLPFTEWRVLYVVYELQNDGSFVIKTFSSPECHLLTEVFFVLRENCNSSGWLIKSTLQSVLLLFQVSIVTERDGSKRILNSDCRPKVKAYILKIDYAPTCAAITYIIRLTFTSA